MPAQMDGFEAAEGVIVVAATNYAESLDAALTRPGRFDRNVAVPLPDVRGRLDITWGPRRRVCSRRQGRRSPAWRLNGAAGCLQMSPAASWSSAARAAAQNGWKKEVHP